MIDRLDNSDRPDLNVLPSAQMQEGRPVSGSGRGIRRRRSLLGLIARVVLTLGLIAVLGAGILVFVVSQGPISSEGITTRIEDQLSGLLGDNHQAKIGSTHIAFGKDGLVSVEARDVKILRAHKTTLGVAEVVRVQLKLSALLVGRLEARRIVLHRSAVSLLPHLPQEAREGGPIGFGAPDMNNSLRQLAVSLDALLGAVEKAKLDSVELDDTEIIGFESLGIRSPNARIVRARLDRNINFQKGLFLSGVLETEHSNILLDGSWTERPDLGPVLTLKTSGARIDDFLKRRFAGDVTLFDFNSPISLVATLPFDATGAPAQAQAQISLEEGSLKLGLSHTSQVQNAQFNIRILPSRNQIVMEKSPIQFTSAETVMVGTYVFPEATQDQTSGAVVKIPGRFEIQAANIVSQAMTQSLPAARGRLTVGGKVGDGTSLISMESIQLESDGGNAVGNGAISIKDDLLNLKLDLDIEKMQVATFKQFWPMFVAPKVRTWSNEALRGGELRNASLRADLPFRSFRPGTLIADEQLRATVPVVGASVRTAGDLPWLENANGTIKHAGVSTNVSIDNATAKPAGGEAFRVSNAGFSIPDFRIKPLTASVRLNMNGSADSLARLGELKPLRFSKSLGLKSGQTSGRVSAKVSSSLEFGAKGKVTPKDWSADIRVKKGSSRSAILGRKFTNADLRVKADQSGLDISGRATIDGVPAELALVQPLGGNGAGRRSVTMQLDNAARKRMGINTGSILDGTIQVSLGTNKDGSTSVTADLTKTRLSFPWIGWSKGKDIQATATFDMKTGGKTVSFKNLVLKGNGFSARGNLTARGGELLTASLRKVRLNKTDDFDVDVKRVKGGYNVDVDARSYDGRALIRSFLETKRPKDSGKTRVRLKGSVNRLIGFNGQSLRGVSVDFVQVGSRVSSAQVRAVASGNAPTSFSLQPANAGLRTRITSGNAGSVLAFLNLYSKVQGGRLDADIVQDSSGVSRGSVKAYNFKLLGEPRLAALFSVKKSSVQGVDPEDVSRVLKTERRQNADVDQLAARIEKGRNYMRISKGRLTGGDASAAFDGLVYDRNGRMNIKGTFLPGRSLNKLVSNIPLLGLAFGKGKVNGLLGITFQLRGAYSNPSIRVNPLSVIAPGVFRQLFKF